MVDGSKGSYHCGCCYWSLTLVNGPPLYEHVLPLGARPPPALLRHPPHHLHRQQVHHTITSHHRDSSSSRRYDNTTQPRSLPPHTRRTALLRHHRQHSMMSLVHRPTGHQRSEVLLQLPYAVVGVRGILIPTLSIYPMHRNTHHGYTTSTTSYLSKPSLLFLLLLLQLPPCQ